MSWFPENVPKMILKMNFNFNIKDKLRAAGPSIGCVTSALDPHHSGKSGIKRDSLLPYQRLTAFHPSRAASNQIVFSAIIVPGAHSMKTTQNRFVARVFACAVILFPLLAAQAAGPRKESPAQPSLPKGPEVNLSYMDRAVRPGDDFYEYANGDWIKNTEIPADRAGTAPALPLADEMDKRVSELITEAAKSDKSSKIANLYDSFMDEAAIEAKGLKPLQPHLDAIKAISNQRELAHALGETLRAPTWMPSTIPTSIRPTFSDFGSPLTSTTWSITPRI